MSTVLYEPKPPGNYLQDYNDQFRAAFNTRQSELNLTALAELAAHGRCAVEKASCWVLNDTARDFIMHTTLPDDALQDWHLPYPRMAIEWCGTWDPAAVLKNQRANEQIYVPALERIILLNETSNVQTLDLLIDPVTGEKTEKEVHCEHSFNGFYLTSLFKQPTDARTGRILESEGPSSPLPWAINPVALLVPYSCFNHLDKWFGKYPDGDLKMLTVPPSATNTQVAEDRPTPVCALMCARTLWPEMLAGRDITEGLRDLIEEVHIALGLLAMLRCDNVPTRTIQASPLKQRRRKQQKKARIPEYRVLHLSDHTLRGYTGGKGAHGEKRPHWRRGHIRNQRTAMGTVRKWIAPQIIRADKLSDGDLPKPRTAIT